MAEKLPELEAIDEAASLIDDETPEIGGLTVFKSGLAASPELRTGLLVTVLMALTAAAGKLMIPILVQLVLDRGLLGDQGYRPGYLWAVSLTALGIVVIVTIATRVTLIRLVAMMDKRQAYRIEAGEAF